MKRNPHEILYLESFATLILINALIGNNLLLASNKMIKVQRNAQTRCSRRFYSWQKGK